MFAALTIALLALSPPLPAPPPGAGTALPAPFATSDWFDCGSDADCYEEEFCRFPPGECGGDGTCTLLPDTCGMEYEPVCGCDGQTYMNSCEGFMDGVSVDYPGDC